jgi:hypothetical protein
MKCKKLVLAVLCGAFAAALPGIVSAAVVFTDDFESDTSGDYTVNLDGGPNGAATFAYDYSAVGIPSAPNSGGTTRGLKLEANYANSNDANEIFSGISVSPTGLSVTADFDLRFDLWQNSIGPFTGSSGDGGSGSTVVTDYGWGTAGTSAQWAGARDSVVFGTTGEGNSGFDWRVYPNAALEGPTSSMYVATPGAGNDADVRNNVHSYYSTNFPGQAPPAAQTLLFPLTQTGAPQDGTTAFAWHEVVISKRGNTLSWSMDGVPIANVDLTTIGALGGSNIFFGQSDINSTASAHADARSLLFGLVDNVELTVIPEPGSIALCLVGAVVGLVSRRRRS